MNNGINKISVYGDSILKGAVTGTGSGHLFDIIEESSLVIACRNLNLELNNQSVFGSIVTKTQRRLKKDVEKGVVGDLAIIESGGNDCDYDWELLVKIQTHKLCLVYLLKIICVSLTKWFSCCAKIKLHL